MKNFLAPIFAAILAVGAVAMAQSMSQNNLASLPDSFAQQAQRAAIHPSGGWTTIDCSDSAAAASAELNAWSRYVIQCGDDSRIAWGLSTVEADANDGYLPEGAWYEFMTTDSIRYVSCLNVNVDSDCRIIEAR